MRQYYEWKVEVCLQARPPFHYVFLVEDYRRESLYLRICYQFFLLFCNKGNCTILLFSFIDPLDKVIP